MTAAERLACRQLASRIVLRHNLHPGAELHIARAIHRHAADGWLLITGTLVVWSPTEPTAYGAPVTKPVVVELAGLINLDLGSAVDVDDATE